MPVTNAEGSKFCDYLFRTIFPVTQPLADDPNDNVILLSAANFWLHFRKSICCTFDQHETVYDINIHKSGAYTLVHSKCTMLQAFSTY